jgi:hypothetical protein
MSPLPPPFYLHVSLLVTLIYLGVLASARPSEDNTDEIVGTWTMTTCSRFCIETGEECLYFLNHKEENFNGQSSGPTNCIVSVASDDPKGRPANQTSFHDRGCYAADGTNHYAVSGGWDPEGFMALTVVNQSEGSVAYYGYADSDLHNDKIVKNVSSAAYVLGTFTKRRAMQELTEHESREAPVEWKIWDLFRRESGYC